MKNSTMEAVETLVNGNKSDFRRWVKKAHKLDLLDAIEYYSGNHGGRYQIINTLRNILDE